MPSLMIERKPFNECGDCKACCIHLPIPVPELNKPVGEPCKHLCDKGCSLHGTPEQPELCQSYRCLWRTWRWMGEKLDYRPDKLKVIFWVNFPKLILTECEAGAIDGARVQYIKNKAAPFFAELRLMQQSATKGLIVGRPGVDGTVQLALPDGTDTQPLYTKVGKEIRVTGWERIPLPIVA